MNCYYHPDRPAVAQCGTCGKGICKECFDEFQEYRINAIPCCPECWNVINKQSTASEYVKLETEYKKYRRQVLLFLLTIVTAIFFLYKMDVNFKETPISEILYQVLIVSLAQSSCIGGYYIARSFRRPSATIVDSTTGEQKEVYYPRRILLTLLLGMFIGPTVGPYYALYIVFYKYPSLLIKMMRYKRKLRTFL